MKTAYPLLLLVAAGIGASLLALVATTYPDKMPWAVPVCKMWEPCKLKLDEYTTINITPTPVVTNQPVVTDSQVTGAVSGTVSVQIEVPVNTSATTTKAE